MPPPTSNLRPFPRGASGNPTGRPKGFGHLIRNRTARGRELVDFMLGMFRGTLVRKQWVKGELEDVGPTLAESYAAAQWLADRGWGRTPETADWTPTQRLSDDEILVRLEALVEERKRQGGQP